MKTGVKLSQVKVMKIAINTKDNRHLVGSPALLVPSGLPDYLVGRLMTLLESLGLPERQEKSIKDLVKNEIYSKVSENNPNVLYIHGKFATLLKIFENDVREEVRGRVDTPFSFGDTGDYEIKFEDTTIED